MPYGLYISSINVPSDGTNNEYHVKDEEGRAALVDIIDTAGKNLVQNNLVSKTRYGVTATTNSDGTITITGKSTATSDFILVQDLYDPEQSSSFTALIPSLKGVEMIAPATGRAGVRLQVLEYNSSSDYSAASNSDSDKTFTLTKDYVCFRIWIKSTSDFTGSPFTFNPIVCLKSAWDISQVFVKYGLTNEQKAIIELIDSGAKNVLNTRAMQTQTASGTTCTCTVNSDYSMTLTGKNTGSSAVFFSIPVSFPKGDYYFTGMPGAGSSSTYRMELRTNSTMGIVYKTVESNLPVDISRDSDWSGYFNIRVASNHDFGSTGVTVKPMICSKIAWLISHAYVPYIPSMAQMYDMILAIQT